MSFHFEEEEEVQQLGLKLDRDHARRLWGFVRPHSRMFLGVFGILVVHFGKREDNLQHERRPRLQDALVLRHMEIASAQRALALGHPE